MYFEKRGGILGEGWGCKLLIMLGVGCG